MSGTPYLDQDTRDEIQRAYDNDIDHAVIAGSIGISVAELCVLMQWPQWKPEPVKADATFDLWAVERLNEVL